MADEPSGGPASRIAEIEKLLGRLDRERAELIAELGRLRRIKDRETGYDVVLPGLVEDEAPLKDTNPVSLFMSLFQGRNDVYAVRWESARTGKSGFQPACKNEWSRGICRKPFGKCGECEARRSR